MKSFTALAIAALAATEVSAHYIFEQFTYAGTKYPAYQYIRQNTNMNSPVIDLTSNDMRCNAGGETAGSTTTIAVTAGSSFSFSTDVAVYHNGPTSLYMSKAPTTAAAYDGSGAWFKIYDWGPSFTSSGASWNLAQTYTGTFPKCIPNGEYLLKIVQLGIHNPYPGGIPQWYSSCAQVSLTGGGSTTPSPTVSIPGAFHSTDPGYVVNIYSNFKNYTVPGPTVFTC